MTHPAGGPPVVAAVDGSPGSLAAAQVAAEEARLRHTRLELVTALPRSSAGLAAPPPSDTDSPGVVHGSAETVLRGLATDLAPLVPAGVVPRVVEQSPEPALHELSTRAQLLVLGSRGAGGVAGLRIGSTATAVVATAECPVLVLPDDTSVTVSRRRSVVVGVEGRPGDETVLAVAVEAAAARETDLVAVHAWRDVRVAGMYQSVSPLIDWGGVRDEEARVLAETLAGWRDKQPDLEIREVVLRDRTAHGLLAVSLTAELLVVGHRRRNRLAALGSTTHGVLHRAGCPLVVVPLPAATAQERED